MIYLGELDLSKATGEILKLFPDDAVDERVSVRGNSTLAVVIVDGDGRPVNGKTFLSSFAWGYGKVRAGCLKDLSSFPQAERSITEALEEHLIRQDNDGRILPLGSTDISEAIDWISRLLGLPDEEVIRPGFAVRVPQWGAFTEAPEPELLNSFFIPDLIKAREQFNTTRVGRALGKFMGQAPLSERRDAVRDRQLLATTLAPRRAPLTRWPGAGRHPLALMQQTAVNHVAAELADNGIVAVNGPPGTGKTTLLRDIVANIVLDRAIAMSKYENPAQAFTHITQMRVGSAYTHLYRLDKSLLGHECVVASSNNKAVENISREIPAIEAVAADLDPPPHYFRSVADAVAAGKDSITDGVCWGLAAAVLGNSANRSAFTQSFYWHDARGMARYLKAVLGLELPPIDEEDDVVSKEKPPRNEIEAHERWRSARREFLTKLEQAETLREKAHSIYEAVTQRVRAGKDVETAVDALREAEKTREEAVKREERAARQRAESASAERKAEDDRNAIFSLRPGFFAQLFLTRKYREWRNQAEMAQSNLLNARDQSRIDANTKRQASLGAEHARTDVRHREAIRVEAEAALAEILETIESSRSSMGRNLADEAFWTEEDAQLQLRSPWMFEEWQQARDALFVQTFALHRAFIDAAAKPLRHNLRAALEVMKGRTLTEQQEPSRRSLWATLFLFVPVISTTFASTAKLFGPLGREQLGWVLIDEAGQALPQAAVGAIWRAERAVVIGDPMQIQPVVTTPPRLVRAIFREHGVEAELWAAPEMSAQTLADRSCWFGTEIATDDGDMWVGSPLRVHRRCENPMFKISNHVAYNGLMIYGTRSGDSLVSDCLGDSHWINVEGAAVDKWSESEGLVALDMLLRLLDAGIENPDVFFITPFRIVADNLRTLIRSSHTIAPRLPGGAREWTQSRVGTVHTFQGKEAEAVIIVLGAPAPHSAGARRWAGHPPNLLNVAVTRAKHRLYVVGNRQAWNSAGAFTHVAQLLPVVNAMHTR